MTVIPTPTAKSLMWNIFAEPLSLVVHPLNHKCILKTLFLKKVASSEKIIFEVCVMVFIIMYIFNIFNIPKFFLYNILINS